MHVFVAIVVIIVVNGILANVAIISALSHTLQDTLDVYVINIAKPNPIVATIAINIRIVVIPSDIVYIDYFALV